MAEKLRSGLAGGTAILLLALALHYFLQHSYPPLLLGSMAASAVLLYAAPHSPFSQPWNLIGGHFISALAGWISVLFIPNPIIAAGVAVGSAIFLMYVLNCLHPPGAATALTLVLSAAQFQQMGWHWVAIVVIDNAGISLLLALIINNALPGRHYPASNAPIHPKVEPNIQPEQTDFEWALAEMDSVIDVSLEDLNRIYALAQEHAKSRFESKIK
jgi:CBS-domain-containing membrane protein